MTTPRGGGGALILVWTISKGIRSGTCFYSVVIIIQWTPYIPIEASIYLSHLTFSQSYTCSTTAKLLTHFLRIASQIKNGNRPKTSPISTTFCKTSSSYFHLSHLLTSPYHSASSHASISGHFCHCDHSIKHSTIYTIHSVQPCPLVDINVPNHPS